jgi:hypothetical protein
MAKGSEPATWKWAGLTRHCDTCGNELRISDVALFYGLKERGIRCFGCVDARREQAIEETLRTLAARPVVKRAAA